MGDPLIIPARTRDTFLQFAPPLIGDDEIAEVVDTLRSDWITSGPKVNRFEADFADFVGAVGAMAVSSCTAALHVALLAAGVRRGDAVITTPMTFCSTVHVIEHVGARPIFADVDPETLNLDPTAVLRILERSGARGRRRVKAVLPVHLYGHPYDRDRVLALARDYGLAVIEDAAHALPAAYKGSMIGAAADAASPTVLAAFSFYATKNLTTAEGGMLTGPEALLAEARIWSLHGMNRDAYKRYSAEGSWYYEVDRPGFKYNMTDILAAIGLHQLRRLPAFHARRMAIAYRYTRAFATLDGVQTPVERSEVRHAWHLYALRLNLEQLKIDRAGFIEALRARGIGASVHFIPVHMQPYYHRKYGYEREDLPIAAREYRRLVSLPLYPRMSDADVEDVIAAVTDIVRQHRR